jgi:hypothetical protein
MEVYENLLSVVNWCWLGTVVGFREHGNLPFVPQRKGFS